MMKFTFLRKPDPRLADHVESLAVFESKPGVPSHLNYLILPSLFSHLCFTLFPHGRSAKAYVWYTGPQSGLAEFPMEGVQTVGARIYPGGATPLLGIPSHLLRDQFIPLEQLWGERGRLLTERLWEAPTGKERAAILEEAPVERIAPSKNETALVVETAKLVQQSHWTLSVNGLANRLGYSSRQLHNKFREGCGFSPKEYLRILRCRFLSQRILKGTTDWQELVHDFGFYDQSHFINDFKEMMKQTPSQFAKRMGRQFNVMDTGKLELKKTENDHYLGSDGKASILVAL